MGKRGFPTNVSGKTGYPHAKNEVETLPTTIQKSWLKIVSQDNKSQMSKANRFYVFGKLTEHTVTSGITIKLPLMNFPRHYES